MATAGTYQQQIVAKEAEIADVQQRIRELEPVANAAPDNEHLQQRLAARKQLLAGLQREKVLLTQQQAVTTAAGCRRKMATAEAYQQQIAQKQALIDTKEADIGRLQQQLQHLKDEAVAVKAQVEGAEAPAQRQALLQLLAGKQQEVGGLQAEVAGLKTEIGGLRTGIEALENAQVLLMQQHAGVFRLRTPMDIIKDAYRAAVRFFTVRVLDRDHQHVKAH